MKLSGLAGHAADATIARRCTFDLRQKSFPGFAIDRLHQRSWNMVARHHKAELLARHEIVAAPQQRACENRTFEVPTPILFGVFGLFMAYLGVMTIGFMNPALALPMIVNSIFVGAFAYVPAKWALMNPKKTDRALTWAELRDRGLGTLTGRASAAETAILVLLLPACILFWGVAVVAIAALV
jgi:hypothetical protein